MGEEFMLGSLKQRGGTIVVAAIVGAVAAGSPAVAAEVVTRGGIPVKKIAVRVAAFGGGIVAVLLAGGAWGRG